MFWEVQESQSETNTRACSIRACLAFVSGFLGFGRRREEESIKMYIVEEDTNGIWIQTEGIHNWENYGEIM